MPQTYSVNWKTTITGASTSVSSDSLDVADSGGKRVIAVLCTTANDNGTALTIANSGTALSWTPIAQTNAVNTCRTAAWWAFGDNNGNRIITVTQGIQDVGKNLACIVHTGAHQTTPVPAGNAFVGSGGTDISQLITPTASGSAIWMICGDWGATNSFAAIANCTLDQTRQEAGQSTSTLIRPTTQPRTDALSFTIGETDTAGTISYVAFEVQAAAAASTFVPYQPWPHRGPMLAQ